MKTIKKDLILTKDTVFDESITVHGSIRGKNGMGYSLTVMGDIKARDINARNIDARNINARNINTKDIDARDINAWDINTADINAWDINAGNIDAWAIDYYAVCFAYKNIKCRSIKGRRENSKHFVLDGKVILYVGGEK